MAKNERHSSEGFSPTQWFLGGQDGVVASICEGNFGQLAALTEGDEDFVENLN